MAAGTLDVIVRFIGDSKSLQDEAGKIDGVGTKIGSVAKGIGGALVGAFALDTVKDWVNGASEAEKISKTLQQTLANAGDATGTWAKHAEDLASSLQSQTGVDDEVIKGGQAILATFHEVSGAAGQTAGIFDEATKAAVDMSAAGFGSVESASTMLGKALQDPLKGITALGRAGVTFTDDQKKQIKVLVDSGDALGAQKIVLGEVEKQVGGTAAASATAADKMAASFGDTTDALGAALIPALNALAPILATVAGFIQDNASWLVPLAVAIGAVVVAIWAFNAAQTAWIAVQGIGKAATAAWTAAQWLLNAAMTANPIGLVVVAVAALIAIIVILIKNWDTVAKAFGVAWQFILDKAAEVFNWIKDHWPLLLAILTGPIGIAVAVIVANWTTIRNGVMAVYSWIASNWPTLLAILTGPIGLAVLAVVKNWDTIKDALGTALNLMRGLWDGFVSFVGSIPSRIVSAFSGLVGQLYAIGKDWMASLARGIGDAAGAVLDKAKSIASSALDLLNPFGSPQTVAFYQGQNVMADFMAGMQSRSRAVSRTVAGVGHTAIPGPSAQAGAGGGGRQVINLNVNVAAGADPVVTGKTIVQFIRSYERANGTAWREAASA